MNCISCIISSVKRLVLLCSALFCLTCWVFCAFFYNIDRFLNILLVKRDMEVMSSWFIHSRRCYNICGHFEDGSSFSQNSQH